MKNAKKLPVALALAGVLALAGCGGGGGDNGSSSNGNGGGNGDASAGVPASALQSSDGFINYMKQLVATAIDTSEPIDLGSATTGPVSDTAEAADI